MDSLKGNKKDIDCLIHRMNRCEANVDKLYAEEPHLVILYCAQ